MLRHYLVAQTSVNAECKSQVPAVCAQRNGCKYITSSISSGLEARKTYCHIPLQLVVRDEQAQHSKLCGEGNEPPYFLNPNCPSIHFDDRSF